MNLPEYARKERTMAETVGTTNQRLTGPPVVDVRTFMGGYQDTTAQLMGGHPTEGWTSAVTIQVSTEGSSVEHIVRDPDLLAAWAGQLLAASMQLRRALEQEED